MLGIIKNTLRSSDGSAIVIALLVIMGLSILAVGFSLVANTETNISSLQQMETKAFYIAQTGLDRAVKELGSDPGWRAGFTDVNFERGKYTVEIYDTSDDGIGIYDPTLPTSYVKVVSRSEVNEVRKEIEALWVNPVMAFNFAYAAGDKITLHNHGTPSAVISSDIHNNSWNGGGISFDSGTRVYGDVSCVGDIVLKDGEATHPTIVYGDVWGASVDIGGDAAVEKYDNLSEMTEGRDLNGDGDTNDTGLTKGLAVVTAESGINANGSSLNDGDTHSVIGNGTVPVVIGAAAPAPIADPRPDFGIYYELVTGSLNYPPGANHVTTPIPGDGDGHYFASEGAFTNWLNSVGTSPVLCWRCAGDGLVKPDNSVACPNCAGTGFDQAVEVSGVMYIDDGGIDLSGYGNNLIIHGSIVVAEGDPNAWDPITVPVPGGEADIERFPDSGSFSLKGGGRPHFTQTYRSSDEGGPYVWNVRELYTGGDTQYLPISEPLDGKAMVEFPGIIVPVKMNVNPAGSGNAYYQGDIGDERMTIMQGVVFAEGDIHFHGSSSGGFNDFFTNNGYEWPALLYHEGVLLGQKLHLCEHYYMQFDPSIAGIGMPFGFGVKFANNEYQGIVAWRENLLEE